METLLITQARTGSTRLPKKVLLTINNKSLLEIHLERLSKSKLLDKIIIATTINPEDEAIVTLGKLLNYEVYQGSEQDVLDRFYQAAKKYKPKYIVRLTSDCPLIDASLIDELIQEIKTKKIDYFTNTFIEKFPDGQDVEVFTFESLERAWKEAKLQSEREHVTPYIRNNSSFLKGKLFTSANYYCEKDYNFVRLTVDEKKDFEVIEHIIKQLGTDKDWKTYADYYINTKEINIINREITRNEGYLKSLNKDVDENI